MGNTLKKAIEQLTIFKLWEHFQLGPDQPTDKGVYLSPFRPEKNPSFSIDTEGKVANDFASEDGFNVASFAQRANAEKGWYEEGAGLADALIKLAGLEWEDAREKEAWIAKRNARFGRPSAAAPGGEGSDSKKMASTVRENRTPTDMEIKLYLDEKKEAQKRAQEAALKERDEALKEPERGKALPEWPDFVEERFLSGTEDLSVSKRIAKSRDWPVEWVDHLLLEEKLSYCLNPWAKARYAAFKVECPVYSVGFGFLGLRAVGYHQRQYFPARNGRPEKKSWVYVPYKPLKPSPVEYVQKLSNAGMTVEALPFVIGDVDNAQVAVIHEGQWDAISFYGATGMMSGWDYPLVAFGLRGIEGREMFLKYWLPWLKDKKPNIWLFPDADDAGAKLHQVRRVKGLTVEIPPFTERLKHWLGYSPVVSVIDRKKFGKDFNDFWRVARPSPELMFKWMRKLELL